MMGSTESPQDSASQPPPATTTASPGSPGPDAVNTGNPLVNQLTRGLEDCDWAQLQAKFTDAMDEHSRAEEGLRTETAKILEVLPSTTRGLKLL